MSTHALLNLIKELGEKKQKCEACFSDFFPEKNINSVILLPAHPASFAHKFLFQRVPASPGMQ